MARSRISSERNLTRRGQNNISSSECDICTKLTKTQSGKHEDLRSGVPVVQGRSMSLLGMISSAMVTEVLDGLRWW
jgi:hypothetical protein